jgi:hypothetical protein
VLKTVLSRFLHDGVDSAAHADLVSDPAGVDDEELQLLGDDLLLPRPGQVVPHPVRAVGAVQQEGGARLSDREHV